MRFPFNPILLVVAHIPQRVSGDCLAACAAMVLNFWGVVIDYQRLVRILRIQRPYGTPFSNIRELSKLNVSITYQQGTLTDLYVALQNGFPCIVAVQTGQLPYWGGHDTQHAVVVVGLDSHFIYLNDPAFLNAPVQVSLGDFDLAWLEQDEFFAVLTP